MSLFLYDFECTRLMDVHKKWFEDEKFSRLYIWCLEPIENRKRRFTTLFASQRHSRKCGGWGIIVNPLSISILEESLISLVVNAAIYPLLKFLCPFMRHISAYSSSDTCISSCTTVVDNYMKKLCRTVVYRAIQLSLAYVCLVHYSTLSIPEMREFIPEPVTVTREKIRWTMIYPLVMSQLYFSLDTEEKVHRNVIYPLTINQLCLSQIF